MGRRKQRVDDAEAVAERVPQWTTASPTRKPVAVVRADWQGRLIALSFAHIFAAKKMMEEVLGGRAYKWRDVRSVETPDGMIVASDALEDIVEYEYANSGEREWTFGEPEAGYIRRFLGVEAARTRPIVHHTAEERPQDTDRPQQRTHTPRAPRVTRERAEGVVGLAEICERLGVDPKDARGVLRGGPFPKSSGGWQWPDGEAESVGKWLEKAIAGRKRR